MAQADSIDFIALAQAGVALRTRDRRAVDISRIDAAAGIIHGSIAMEGTLRWRRDGSFADAPGGAAGPFDLVVPDTAAAAGTARVSLRDALAEEEASARAPFCCD